MPVLRWDLRVSTALLGVSMLREVLQELLNTGSITGSMDKRTGPVPNTVRSSEGEDCGQARHLEVLCFSMSDFPIDPVVPSQVRYDWTLQTYT